MPHCSAQYGQCVVVADDPDPLPVMRVDPSKARALARRDQEPLVVGFPLKILAA
jgi:hypothetical protein